MTECKVTGRKLPEAKHDRDLVFGVSIGQGQDFTAITALQRIESLSGKAKNGRWLTEVKYRARHLVALLDDLQRHVEDLAELAQLVNGPDAISVEGHYASGMRIAPGG